MDAVPAASPQEQARSPRACSLYWCAECDLPAGDPAGAGWACWACGGPVASQPQVNYWNNPAFGALLDERLAQLRAGESVTLAEFGPRVRFAPGTAAELLLLQALDGDPDG
jgi:hypothetical protein